MNCNFTYLAFTTLRKFCVFNKFINIKQLKILYENNDIDINSFTELFEKYSIKLETIEHAIRNIQAPENKKEQNKLKSPLIESTVR